jgi:ribosomal protein S18 acetylase RimI-like enzyme
MVMAATTETKCQAQGSLRPTDPTRDLGTIADLIADAFAQEIDERGRAALREMRWMALLSPLVWWWAQADPSFRDTFNGFVWEEADPAGRGKRIVGNVSLNRAPGSRRWWIICNVVVQAEYRGQGIGRDLTAAAVAEAQTLGAQGVILQVYQDNPPAWGLYTGLGFREATGETELRLEAVKDVPPPDVPGYRFQAWRPDDGQAAYELARLVIPPVQHWIRPVRADQYQPSWSTRLGERFTALMGRRRVYRLAVHKESRLVAVLRVTAALRWGEHRIEFLIHPEHTGQVDAALISRALHMLAALPSKPVRITVDKDHTQVLEVLHSYGFQEQRTLLTMRKDFG